MARLPYTNFHDLNLDFVLKVIKKAFTPDNPPPYPVKSFNGLTGNVSVTGDIIPLAPNNPEMVTDALREKQDAPASPGTPGQVLGLDQNQTPVWIDQTNPTSIIDDNAGGGDTDKVYSANHVTGLISPIIDDITDIVDDVGDIKSAFDELNDHVNYDNYTLVAENDIATTAGTKINSQSSSFSASVLSGDKFAFEVIAPSGTISKFALYYNNDATKRLGTNLSANTKYIFTASENITSFYIYVGASDVGASKTIRLIVNTVTYNDNSVDKKIADIESVLDEMSVLRWNKWELDRNAFTTICVHHDNFSREMTGFEIGMNAGGSDEGNAYDWVTPNDYDDGLRVDDGATFESGTRTYSFSLRKIAEPVSDNFMIETNAPVTDYPVMFGFNVTDILNFQRLEIRKNNAGYRMFMNTIVNGTSQTPSIFDLQVASVIGKVISIYCVHGIMYFYLDDTLLCSPFVGSLGNYVYIASNKSYNTHFDFVNVFNIVSKTSWNPNRILDDGVSDIPLKTVSANEGNYELQNTTTRWSNYADHMTLHSDDPLIHSGRRCEISVGNMNDFKGNLRHFVISFDVFFPSAYVDTEQGDLFIQTHDRDGTYRGTVPFALYIKDNVININTSSTYAPKDDSTSVVVDLHRFDFAEVELGKWHHFEIEIKERYEEGQNPFVRIKIDGKTEFEYRKANCYNDLLGTSPQYGIYKNNWGTGVTEFQRYFDNFRIDYI